MSNPGALALQVLIDHANQTTGGSDTTLTDAINTLIAGYGGGGDIEPWKTVTLAEDHESVGIANPAYWGEFLEITTQDDFEGALYLVLFTNNVGAVRPEYNADMLIYVQVDGVVKSVNSRGAYSAASATMGTSRALHASAGTVIKVYRIAEDNTEQYPVGEEIVSRYIGRDWSTGQVPMVRGRVNHETGLYEPDENGDYNISLNYIPVSPSYQYTKSGSSGFLYRVLFYDEEKNFLSGLRFTPNWNIWFSFAVPAEARYMRIATHSSDSYKNVYVIRSA